MCTISSRSQRKVYEVKIAAVNDDSPREKKESDQSFLNELKRIIVNQCEAFHLHWNLAEPSSLQATNTLNIFGNFSIVDSNYFAQIKTLMKKILMACNADGSAAS